jgi:hypothetical protein
LTIAVVGVTDEMDANIIEPPVNVATTTGADANGIGNVTVAPAFPAPLNATATVPD